MTPFLVGVVLPSLASQREQGLDLRTAARHAEAVGLASIWHGDHLATGSPVLEIAVGLATAAAVTERVSIGAGVLVPALRPLVLVAKQIASIQHVSAGRLILGIGSGGGPAQWAATGVPYAERGALTDQALERLPGLLAGEQVSVHDEQIALAPAVPRPPFLVGNASRIAIRRAARLGDGWFPSLISPAAVAIGAAQLSELADGPRMIAVGATGALGEQVRSQQDIERTISTAYGVPADGVPITGNPSQAADRLDQFRQAGADHVVMGFADGDWRQQCDLLAEATALLT